MLEILIGQTDYSAFVYIPDPASTDGSGKTGLVAANLTVSYSRMETDNDATVSDVTSSLSDLAALTTAHTDWGLKEISSSLAPGLYRLDIADAVFATGAWTAVVYVMITTSAAAASPIQFVLKAVDPDVALAAIKAKTDNLGVIRQDTCQTDGSPDSTHAVLDSSASASDDFYNGYWFAIVKGTGLGQQPRAITDYVGSTKRVLLDPPLSTVLDNTTEFAIFS